MNEIKEHIELLKKKLDFGLKYGHLNEIAKKDVLLSLANIENVVKENELLNGTIGSLNIDEIKKAVYKFKKEELPDAEIPYHFESEIWSGIQSFIDWLESNDS